MTRLLIGLALSSLGTGLTLPFTLILLHEVRGIALQTTGLLLAVPAVVGLAAVPVSGALVDRVGPRLVLRVALLLQAIAQALLAVAGTSLTVLPAMVLLGLGLDRPSPPSRRCSAAWCRSRPRRPAPMACSSRCSTPASAWAA